MEKEEAMFEKILIATDLSSASFEVARCASGLKRFGAQEALLALCISTGEAVSVAYGKDDHFIKDALEKQKRIMEENGLSVRTEILRGSPAEEINRMANEAGYSLIVVGSHGHSLAAEIFLGGVAAAILHRASLPALVVRLNISHQAGEACVLAPSCDLSDHVLFPTDFSESAEHAFDFMAKLVSKGPKKVSLVHVHDKSRIEPYLTDKLDEFDRKDRSRLETMKSRLLEAGKTDVDIHVIFGHPKEEVLRLIKEKQPSLVVMATRGKGYVKEVLMGSVSHAVARHGETSVLLIP
jgi:nucleotide-binding universal stress UspA family protein